jgi:acyl-CoA synthetase (AMP-forming)/AMP-acid ligase II
MRSYGTIPRKLAGVPRRLVRTGDVGRQDDGFFYILDRLKDAARRRRLFRRVEAVIYEHPAVLEAAVGIPDRKWGDWWRPARVLKPEWPQRLN